jgi:hypothetical protein
VAASDAAADNPLPEPPDAAEEPVRLEALEDPDPLDDPAVPAVDLELEAPTELVPEDELADPAADPADPTLDPALDPLPPDLAELVVEPFAPEPFGPELAEPVAPEPADPDWWDIA